MDKKALIPRNIFQIKGKLSYSESIGAWNTIRFKKELIKEFPQLSEKRSNLSYQIVHYRNYGEFEKAIKELKEQKDAILPILLWLYKEME